MSVPAASADRAEDELVIPSRFAVRERPLSQAKRLGYMGGGAYAVIGATGTLNYFFVPYEHTTLWLALSVGTLLVGLATLIMVKVSPDRLFPALYPPAAIALVLYGIFLAPPYIFSAGYPEQAQGTVGYAIVLFFAFYVLKGSLAFVCAVLTVVGQGFVEYTSGVAAPELRLLWLFSFLIVMAVLFNHFSDALESERTEKVRALAELADLNANLEREVASQVDEVERLGRLRRFLSTPVADAVLSSSDQSLLEPHRREIAVLFCDLRGFTAFTKQVEPEEVVAVLDAYYAAAGEQISRFQATLGSFEGDGLMAYLNDPNPCDEPARRVIEMGMAIGDSIDELVPTWHEHGYELSYGIGMALGHATLGVVGYEGRSDYTALGTVVNLAARLCSAAGPRDLIADHRVVVKAGDRFAYQELPSADLKGFSDPVRNYKVVRT